MLTAKQAAARLGVSPRRVRQLIDAGYLEATKFANRWQVTGEALAAYEAYRKSEAFSANGGAGMHKTKKTGAR